MYWLTCAHTVALKQFDSDAPGKKNNKMETKHTPGPWRWELNKRHKQIQLCGGVPKFDLIVMDFVRYGMQRAQPRFLDPKERDEHSLNVMSPADNYSSIVPGREHHEDWFRNISHPDAQLIASAPDLLQALDSISNVSEIKGIDNCFYGDTDYDSPAVAFGYNLALEHVRRLACAAITKATTI